MWIPFFFCGSVKREEGFEAAGLLTRGDVGGFKFTVLTASSKGDQVRVNQIGEGGGVLRVLRVPCASTEEGGGCLRLSHGIKGSAKGPRLTASPACSSSPQRPPRNSSEGTSRPAVRFPRRSPWGPGPIARGDTPILPQLRFHCHGAILNFYFFLNGSRVFCFESSSS